MLTLIVHACVTADKERHFYLELQVLDGLEQGGHTGPLVCIRSLPGCCSCHTGRGCSVPGCAPPPAVQMTGQALAPASGPRLGGMGLDTAHPHCRTQPRGSSGDCRGAPALWSGRVAVNAWVLRLAEPPVAMWQRCGWGAHEVTRVKAANGEAGRGLCSPQGGARDAVHGPRCLGVRVLTPAEGLSQFALFIYDNNKYSKTKFPQASEKHVMRRCPLVPPVTSRTLRVGIGSPRCAPANASRRVCTSIGLKVFSDVGWRFFMCPVVSHTEITSVAVSLAWPW